MPEKKIGCRVLPCNIEHDSFVFISYAHQDSEKVFPIIELVNASGYPMWYDKGINISSIWTDEIALAILNCKVFIIFVSKNAVESPYVRSEIEFALNNKIRIIPIYLDGMEILPPGLALGLSATQGILDISNSRGVAEQICNALEYNKIRKEDAEKIIHHALVEPKERLSFAYLGAGALAIIAIVTLLLLSFSGKTPDEPQEPGLADMAKMETPASAPALPSKTSSDAAIQETVQETAPAGQIPQGQTSSLPKGRFALEKNTYAPVEAIYIDLSSLLTEEMIRNGSIVCVSLAGAAQGDYLSYEFITAYNLNSLVKLRAPLNSGAYEVRWYDNGNSLTQASLAGSAKFTVKPNPRKAFSFNVEKTLFAPEEDIVVRVSGVSKRLIDDFALVGVFQKNSEPGKWIEYQPIRTRDERILLRAPRTPGEYEIRSHITNYLLDEPTIIARVPFVVK